jgi:hypothetical protein
MGSNEDKSVLFFASKAEMHGFAAKLILDICEEY